MRTVRALTLVMLVAISTCLSPAWGTEFSTDQSDLWWNPSESGWGMQLVERGSTIFATLFVYDQTNNPIWYVATLVPTGTSYVWSGDLYLTNGGSWFGAVPFNPNAVSARKVGTMTWNGTFVQSGTVSYSVDGVQVTKNVVRQFIAYDNYNGAFVGAVATGCFNPNGASGFVYGGFTISQTGQTVSLVYTDLANHFCTVAGTLTQGGQFGRIQGNFSCTDGSVGTFDMYEMYVAEHEMRARFDIHGTNTACSQINTHFGGLKAQ